MYRKYKCVSAASIIYSFCLIQDDVPPLDYLFFFFPIWRECWHYALCLRYQRFVASRCLVSARQGSFTKHEMDKASVMYCLKKKKKVKEWKKEWDKRGGEMKIYTVIGFFCLGQRRVVAASECCCLFWDAGVWRSQESEPVGTKTLNIAGEVWSGLCVSEGIVYYTL